MENTACLASVTGDPIALKAAEISGRLEGLLLRMKVRQHYRNDTREVLETVYTFPLAWEAVLLGMSVSLGGKRLDGQVVEKARARDRYEEAVEQGDAPVLVESDGHGLYTAQLGNLKPGEEALVEFEYAQLLRFEQGRIRLCVPTTIAPRYGDPHAQGGMPLHASTASSTTARYPLSLSLDIVGEVARSRIGSPSHPVGLAMIDGGVRVSLIQQGWLDRDVLLTLDEVKAQSFALTSRAADGSVAVLASFCPALPVDMRRPLRLKLLVDCSGSMGGDSIESARRALHELAQGLQPADAVSYSRFGSEVQHDLPKLEWASAALVKALSRAIRGTEADLGGTELSRAIVSTVRDIAPPAGEPGEGADILLITDGEVWDIDGILGASRRGAHRIFAIGVGSAPGESLLRQLAEDTGGACEFVAPNEDMTAAVLRLFRRLRSARAEGLELAWDVAPQWQAALPKGVFDGETVHVHARFSGARASSTARPPVLVWQTLDEIGEVCTGRASAERLQETLDDTLSRLAGAVQMREAEDAEEKLALALRHRLIGARTSLVLVHERAEADRTRGLATLQQVPQMHAAGSHGVGSVRPRADALVLSACMAPARFSRAMQPSCDIPGAPPVRASSRISFGTDPAPNGVAGPDRGTATPAEVLGRFEEAVQAGGDFTTVLAALSAMNLPGEAKRVIAWMTGPLGSEELAWAVLLDHLMSRSSRRSEMGQATTRLLESALADLEPAALVELRRAVDKALPGLTDGSWGTRGARPTRLRSILAGLAGAGGGQA